MRPPRWPSRVRSRRLGLALVTGITFLAVVPGGVQAQGPPTWTGTWADLTFGGQFQLVQNGARVTGSYTFCSGSIDGTVSGNTLSGTWHQSQAGCSPEGWFAFTLDATGRGFSGSWGYPTTPTNTPAGSWSGTCTAGACTQNGATPPPQTGGSCGTFGVFDPDNPPGTVEIEPGTPISYELDPGDATLTRNSTRISWGDSTSDRLRTNLRRPDTFEFIHIYYESGTYLIQLTVVGTLGASCRNDVDVGTVVIPQPTAPLIPRIAAGKCDDFLRKASGRVGRIIRSATSQPRTRCPQARRLSRTCTTTVVDRRKCKCRYKIKTRVPASGRPKVLSVSRRRV